MRELLDGRYVVTVAALSILVALLASACSRNENNAVGAAFLEDLADQRAVVDTTLSPPDSTTDFQLDEPADNIPNSAVLLVGERPSLGLLSSAVVRWLDTAFPDSGGTAIEASLSLKYRGGAREGDPPFSMTIHRVTSDWSEAGLDTMMVLPSIGAALDTLALGTPAEEDTVEILTDGLVQYWIDHPDSNFGLALTPVAGAASMLEFDAVEAVLSEPPRLSFRYVSATADTSNFLFLPTQDSTVLQKTGSFVPIAGQPARLSVGRGFPTRSLVRFAALDSIESLGALATVNRAEVVFAVDSTASDFREFNVQIRRVTSDEWMGPDTGESSTFSQELVSPGDAELKFDVTRLVEEIRREGNRGFLVRPSDERPNVDYVRFFDDATSPARLRVWWTPGGTP